MQWVGQGTAANAAAALQVLLMGEQDFAVYMQAQHGTSSSSGHRTPAFPSLLDMNTLEDAAEDDPDFCSDVCSVLLAALSSRVKLYAPAEAAARSADATGSYRLQCAAQVTAASVHFALHQNQMATWLHATSPQSPPPRQRALKCGVSLGAQGRAGHLVTGIALGRAAAGQARRGGG
jgi:hypothetical protein